MHSGNAGDHWLLMLHFMVASPIILYPGLQLYVTEDENLCGGLDPATNTAFCITGSLHSTPASTKKVKMLNKNDNTATVNIKNVQTETHLQTQFGGSGWNFSFSEHTESLVPLSVNPVLQK